MDINHIEHFILEFLNEYRKGGSIHELKRKIEFKYKKQVELSDLIEIIDKNLNQSKIYYDNLNSKYKILTSNNINDKVIILNNLDKQLKFNLENAYYQNLISKLIVRNFYTVIPSKTDLLYQRIFYFLKEFKCFIQENNFDFKNENITYRVQDFPNKKYIKYLDLFTDFLIYEDERYININPEKFDSFWKYLEIKINLIEQKINHPNGVKTLSNFRSFFQLLNNIDNENLKIIESSPTYKSVINQLIVFKETFENQEQIDNIDLRAFYSRQKKYLVSFLSYFKLIRPINNTISYKIRDFEDFKDEINFLENYFEVNHTSGYFNLKDINQFKLLIKAIEHKIKAINVAFQDTIN